jgi:NifU-like domain
MARDVMAKFALDKARTIVAEDGDLELKDVRDNVVYIRYRARKSAADCAQCVIGPGDLKDFLADIFRTTAPHIKDFDIEFEALAT